MRPITGRSSTPMPVSGVDLPGQTGARGQTILTGPGQTVVISEIDDEEAIEWDRIVAMRATGSC